MYPHIFGHLIFYSNLWFQFLHDTAPKVYFTGEAWGHKCKKGKKWSSEKPYTLYQTPQNQIPAHFLLNSQAVGMDSWVQYALKSILRGTLFSNRLHDYSLLSSNSFLHPFDFKIHEKNIIKQQPKQYLTPTALELKFIMTISFIKCF